MRTIYGVFDRVDQARQALTDLASAGFSEQRVGLLAKQPGVVLGVTMTPLEIPGLHRVAANGAMREMLSSVSRQDMRGVLERVGVPSGEINRCADALERGAILETVVVDDDKAVGARAIMNRYSNAAAARAMRTDDTRQSFEDIVVPVIREELRVGTRSVDTGGVRVASHVRTVPVEQTITIREERVTVERRILDRTIADTEDAFRERTVELKAMSEEPVVSKRAHVVEEIRVHKDRAERIEKIDDVLRHTEVEVSELPGERRFDAASYRDDFAKTYGASTDWKVVAPAYEFGETLARRSPERDWVRVEGDARSAWEKRNPGTWDRFKAAVETGWRRTRRS